MSEKKTDLSWSEKKILSVLDDYQPRDRTWISEQTKIPRTTVYDTLQRLKRYGIIESWSKSHGRGRPKTMFCKKLPSNLLSEE